MPSPSDDTILFDENKVLQRISREVAAGRLINALLLSHGYIEAYLLEILLYSGPYPLSRRALRASFSRRIVEHIEKISFTNLLHINLIIGNVSPSLYERIQTFNKKRNTIVHELISIDLTSEKEQRMIEKQIQNAMTICTTLANVYKRKIRERSASLERAS